MRKASRLRGLHLTEMLKKDLFVEMEQPHLNLGIRYLKVIAPFETLCDQAENDKVMMPLSEKVMIDTDDSISIKWDF
jgi:hypothetical protein